MTTRRESEIARDVWNAAPVRLQIGLAALSIAGLFLLSGCGGGTSATDALAGNWRVVSIGPDGGAAVNCPGSYTTGTGEETEEVACGANDRLTFERNALTGLSVDDDGHRVRTRGTFRRVGNRLELSTVDVAVDANDNGVFETGEVEAIDPPLTFNSTIRSLTDTRMVLGSSFYGPTTVVTLAR